MSQMQAEDKMKDMEENETADDLARLYIDSPVARTFFCCTVCLRTFAHFSCVSHTRMAQA